MKKLLIIVFVAGFVGLGFAYSPSKVVTTNDNISLLSDTTKTKKKSTTTTKKSCTTTKECGKKSSCCKSGTKETPKKVN